MIKIVSVFVIFTMAFAIGIDLIRKMKGAEIWHFTKTLGYSILCAALAMIALTTIVVIF